MYGLTLVTVLEEFVPNAAKQLLSSSSQGASMRKLNLKGHVSEPLWCQLTLLG